MNDHIKHYKYSEIFGDTFQGEGKYTGVPTVWLRFWGCNLSCSGFGQKDPTDPSTWKLDYQTIDVSSIKRMEDLPVFNTGCDSSYSWAKKFAHLAPTGTVEEICDRIEDLLRNEHNPDGKFLHPKSNQWTHMAFTGGEPMINQNAIVEIMLEFARRKNVPKFVTVETNGTQMPRVAFREYLAGVEDNPQPWESELFESNLTASNYRDSFYMNQLKWSFAENFSPLSEEHEALRGIEWFWSVSPKLYLSGEKWDEAIQPDVVAAYANLSNAGQLKYVCDGSARAWEEVERATKLYRDAGVTWPVYIMPVGATVDGQNLVAANVAEEAVRRGYIVSARVHCYVFSNQIGK